MIKNNHGHIVALSSIAGMVGFPNLVPYCATKFAVRGNQVFFLFAVYTNEKILFNLLC